MLNLFNNNHSGTALCEPPGADFVAGAALCEPSCTDFVAGAALCEPPCGGFVAGTAENWRLSSTTLVRGAICRAGS